MDGQATTGILRHFRDLPDPRAHNVIHQLHDILVIAICAVICGAEGWAEVEQFGLSKQAWFGTFLSLDHGIPSHDTFGRVFAKLNPDAFERCFVAWTQSLPQTTGGMRLIAIDGKSIRRSFEHAWDKSGMAHLVSAFVDANHIVFSQVAVSEKNNEIEAIGRLLGLLDLHGATVTIDALGCQTEIAGQIVEAEGDYVLAVKENQPTLHAAVKRLLDEAILENFEGMRHDSIEMTDGGHGRIETRRVWVTDQVQWLGGAVHARGDRRQDQHRASLLHQQPQEPIGEDGGRCGAWALVGGEQVALATGRELQRGPVPAAQGPLGRELQSAVPAGAEPAQAG
jgi:predicted transposase YbfD/YdcC